MSYKCNPLHNANAILKTVKLSKNAQILKSIYACTHTREREMPLDIVKSQKTLSASSVNYKDLKVGRKSVMKQYSN